MVTTPAPSLSLGTILEKPFFGLLGKAMIGFPLSEIEAPRIQEKFGLPVVVIRDE